MAPSAGVPWYVRQGRRNGGITTDLHLDLQLILQNSAELLHIVLHEGIEGLPSERLGQFSRTCASAQPIRDALEQLTNW
jgi:hypothetical protein